MITTIESNCFVVLPIVIMQIYLLYLFPQNFPKKFEKWTPKNSRTTNSIKKVRFFQEYIETYMQFKTFRFCIHDMVLRPGTEHQILTNV